MIGYVIEITDPCGRAVAVVRVKVLIGTDPVRLEPDLTKFTPERAPGYSVFVKYTPEVI